MTRRRERRRQGRTITAAISLLLLLTVPAGAGSGGVDLPPPGERSEGHPRLDTRLAAIARGEGPTPDGPPGFMDVEVFPVPGRASTVVLSVGALGGREIVRVGEVVVASLPVAAVAALGRNPNIAWVQAATIPVPEVVGQGVAFIDADDWHAAGFTGTGVKVAVIDLGFKGYQPRQAQGELPQGSALKTRDEGCNDFDGPAANDHGTAVAEIVHEVAPGATIYLICVANLGDLLDAVTYAASEGVTVINHSVGWFHTGRGDGTGSMQPIFQAARNSGILWVNSAGNYALGHWSGTFVDGDADGYLEFPNGGETLRVDEGEYPGSISVDMKWDDWPATSTDYRLELWRESPVNVLTPVVIDVDNLQTGTQPPWERIEFAGPQGIRLHIAIFKVSGGPATPEIDLFALGNDLLEVDRVTARSLNDPATSPLVTAVGAVYYDTEIVEPFSSRGPTIDGGLKPDLTGPDGVSNVTYGSFFGTSASAPHVAGAAALVRHANPGISAAALHAFLLSRTRDAGVAGPDNSYGTGILDLGSPDSQPVGLVDPSQGRWHLREGIQSTNFFFGNPGDIPFMGDWDCDGIETPGLYRQSDGFVYLRNTNTQGNADITFFFGNPGDVPIAGDFDNDTCDTVSIYRPSQARFYIINQLGQNGGGLGAAETSYVFGNPGDKPFVGDFDGDGIETVGLHRESTGLVYFRNSHTQGNADSQFFFGNPGDRFVAGDWNGNDIDSPGIFRPGNTTFYFRYTNTQGNADEISVWGEAPWLPVAGRSFFP